MIHINTGISKNHIILTLTHTHSGPLTATLVGWGIANEEYTNSTFIPRTLKAAKKGAQQSACGTSGH